MACGPGGPRIADPRPVGRSLVGTPIPLFFAALVPPAIVFPLRFLAFGDENPVTLVLLGPALEEGLKLAGLLLALMLAALFLPRGQDPANALRYWLFLAPWLVGGLYGMMEGFLVYAGQNAFDFTLREFAHATFAALGLAVALWVWRVFGLTYAGVGLGFSAAWAAHILFNTLALVSNYSDVTLADQVAYAALLGLLAVAALARAVAREPGSRETGLFLAIRGGLRA